MAVNLSTYLANKLLDHTLRSVSYTAPTAYVALFTTSPTMPAGTGGVEVTGGSYARQALAAALTAASAESITNGTAAITFPTASANWGIIVGVGIYDASTTGNLLYATAVNPTTVNNGDIYQIPLSDLTGALS